MSKNTSISLGTHFDNFVQSRISAGRFKNASEVIRAGLRLLEEEESKMIALQMANFRLTKKAVEDLSEIWNYTIDT